MYDKLLTRLSIGFISAGVATGALGIAINAKAQPDCSSPTGVIQLQFSKRTYPDIYQHYLDATAKGWPRVMTLWRDGASDRRITLLRPYRTLDGLDRDEYPPAATRTGWLADVEYVPASENRSQGASLGAKLRPYCDGTEIQYKWVP